MKNKTTTIISGAVFVILTGCGTTEADRSATHPNGRVDRQWAREAGMHDQEWYVTRTAPIVTEAGVEETAAISQELASTETSAGGASTTGQTVEATRGQGRAAPEITITKEAAGLEILDQADIALRKEELVVGKRTVSNGGVLVRTVVETEQVSQPVELKREEYVIERIPAGSERDQQARVENAFKGREVYIPLTREEPVTQKRVLLTEAVKLGKKTETDQQTVTAPVRTEDLEIVKNPDLSDPKFSSVPRHTARTTAAGAPAAAAREQVDSGTLRLAKEELVIGKQEVDAGGVYLQKVIKTDTASQPIELRREEYTIDRSPLSGEAGSADFTPRQISIQLTREEPVTDTRAYVAEIVRVRKQIDTDQQMVSGTVRKEALEIVKLPEGQTSGQGGTGISAQSGVTTIAESESPNRTRDEILAEHVTSALAKPGSGEMAYPNIEVTSQDSVVTLKGTVDSEKEKKAIEKRVKKLSGVRNVNNELGIKP
jgi:uncharacterized protein (TIGR02271 family)